jgi:hypothetical protein
LFALMRCKDEVEPKRVIDRTVIDALSEVGGRARVGYQRRRVEVAQ